MKVPTRFCVLLLLLLFVSDALAQIPGPDYLAPTPKVAKIEIKHVGPPAVSDDLVRANIRVKVGDPYTRMAVDDDVQNLYATGQFYTVRVSFDTTPEGVILTYTVQGKPRLSEIKFQGNTKFSTSKLKKKLTSKVGDPLDERKLFTDGQEIQKFYEKKGYPGTTVKAVPSVLQESGRAVATFEITESPKVRIEDIQFVGASAFTQRQLRGVIKTKRHGFFSWLTRRGVFKDEQFDDDKGRLADFYRSKGYIDFELKDVQFEKPTEGRMIIRFIIYEGRQYKVGSVKFTGNKLFTDEQIAAGLRALQPSGGLVKKAKLGPNGLRMDVGDVFTPKGYADNIKQIQDFYGAKGYLDVASSRNLDVIRVPNTETGTMDLEFKIDEGQKTYIEKIEIRGNWKTKDKVIRRELAVSPGEVFDMVRVDISKQRLEGLQYFQKVDARPEPTDPPIAGRKDLAIRVEEANTGNLTAGAGFSSVDSLVVFGEIAQGNFDLFNPPRFTGGGQKFRLRVQLGTERQDYLVSFVEPWFLGRRLQLGVDLYHHEWNFQSLENLYDERRTGAHIGLLRELPRPEFIQRIAPSSRIVGGIGYRIEDVGIDFNGHVENNNGLPKPVPAIPNALLVDEGSTLISKFDASLSFDTRGPGMLPEKGQQTELYGEIAGPWGGTENYWVLGLKTHWYFKGLFPGHVLEVLGGIKASDAWGSTADTPFYDRFYLGGINDLRGFRYRSVGPREKNSGSKEPIGGDSYWLGSIEYSLPIIERLRIAVFYDVGDVQRHPYDYSAADYSDNWGIGLRLNLPIGGKQGMPLRLDYGVPIHFQDRWNSGSGQFQFSAGFDRPF